MGYKTDKFKKRNHLFELYDMSGQSKYRSLWEKYYELCEGIVFVVDSADDLRVAVAKNELEIILENESK